MIEWLVFYWCGMVVSAVLFGEGDLWEDIWSFWNWPWKLLKGVWKLVRILLGKDRWHI